MAVIEQQPALGTINYNDYMSEGVVNRRYDIVDGIRILMTNPSMAHQRILIRLTNLLFAYEQASGKGKVFIAPCDVLIRREPLRTRQPDLLYLTVEQLGSRDLTDPSPLEAAPSLVVEILSPSETPRSRRDKIADYCIAGVRECWVISPQAETVEVMRLTPDGPVVDQVYAFEQTLVAVSLPDLAIPVSRIFGD